MNTIAKTANATRTAIGTAIPTAIITVAVLLAMLLFPACSWAGELFFNKKKAETPSAARVWAKGKTVKNGKENYAVLEGVWAVKAFRGEPDDQHSLTLAGVTSGEVLERKGPHILFRDLAKPGKKINPSRKTTGTGKPVYTVVQNQRTGRLGVVLGTIQVRLRDADAAERLAGAFGLSIQQQFRHLGFVFFRIAPGQDPFSIAEALGKDADVKQAVVEILENPALPH